MVEAPSRELAATQIKSYGLLPARILPAKSKSGKRKSSSRGGSQEAGKAPIVKKPVYFGPAIGKKGMTAFTRQLSTLLQAGMPLLRSLEVLLAQEKNLPFKWLISQLADSIRTGNPLSSGLARFSKEFDVLYVNMVRAGEASGMLEVVLSRLSIYLEKVQRMKAKLLSALIYPIVVAGMSVLIVGVLLVFVVPQFQQIFEDQFQEQSLPAITVVVMTASMMIKDHFMATLGILLSPILLFKLFKATGLGEYAIDWLKLKFFRVGEVFTKIYISRFSRTFGTLMESGVPILDALRITRDACGNQVVMRAVDTVHRRVRDGENVAGPLESTGIFPPMVTSMIEVGEETGELSSMLSQVADIYDEEVDNSVMGLTSVIEPILIVCLALVIVCVLLALFLPFIQIMQGFAS